MSQQSQPQTSQKTATHLPCPAAGSLKADHREATSTAKEQDPFQQALEPMLDRACRTDQGNQIDVTLLISVKVGSIASAAKTHTCASNADRFPLFSERYPHNNKIGDR
jgi:hypothetical protein